jgi:tRNA-2-methylthio-N6-dimethylallyladenosine synthase
VTPEGAPGFYHLITFGCQMNDHDSEIIAGILEGMGFRAVDRAEAADLVVVNTCCVRASAENKVYARLGELGRLKRLKPHLVIAVGGCLPQREGAAEELVRRFPQVDVIFGARNLHRLPELLARAAVGRPVVGLWAPPDEPPEGLPARRAPGVKAWVTVMYGCNNFCSYCVVPFVRGPERSRPPEAILAEVEDLVRRGYREVTLLGQNVNAYGRDIGNVTFADLLRRLDRVPGLMRIRFTTSHPRDFDDRLIEAMAGGRHICEHVHLPVQAGSNRILARMNRGYTREQYLDLVGRLRAVLPGVGLTTDVMVGFPGEEDEDFEATLDLVRRVRFDAAFTFVYNPRPGTPAAAWPDQVPPEVRRRRIQELITLQRQISLENNRAEEGRVVEVLVEGPSETDPARLCGRTRNFKMVVFPGPGDLVGKLVRVEILAGKVNHLEGRIVEQG